MDVSSVVLVTRIENRRQRMADRHRQPRLEHFERRAEEAAHIAAAFLTALPELTDALQRGTNQGSAIATHSSSKMPSSRENKLSKRPTAKAAPLPQSSCIRRG